MGSNVFSIINDPQLLRKGNSNAVSFFVVLNIFLEDSTKLLNSIQINQLTRCNSFTSLLLDVHLWLNMFRAPVRPSSGTCNCTNNLWFYRWSVAVGAFVGRDLAGYNCQTTTNNTPTATLQQ
jgi:hypothetical protein